MTSPSRPVISAISQCKWIMHPEYGRVLDMRPFTSIVSSNTSSPEVARQFAFNRGSDGSEYLDEDINNGVALHYDDVGSWGSMYVIGKNQESPLRTAIQTNSLKPFVLFSAPEMEWKWDAYARASSIDRDKRGALFDIVFCRSWGVQESKLKMRWDFRDADSHDLEGSVLTCDTTAKFANDPIFVAHYDFLIKALVCVTEHPIPHPLDVGAMLEDDHIESAVHWSFAVHGRQAQYGKLPRDGSTVDFKLKT